MALSLVSGPAVEPCSLSDVKLQLNMEDSFTASDSLLTDIIKSVREEFEQAQRRQLITATWRLSLDCYSGNEIIFPLPPLQSVVSVKYFDSNNVEQTFSSDNYDVDTYSTPGRLVLKQNSSFPNTYNKPNAVNIEFKCGYGDDPTDVPYKTRHGIKLQTVFYYENRGDSDVKMPEGIKILKKSGSWGSYK